MVPVKALESYSLNRPPVSLMTVGLTVLATRTWAEVVGVGGVVQA